MNYSNDCCKELAGLPANKPEHLVVAQRMAEEILSQEASMSIDMVREITNIVKVTLQDRISQAVEKQKYLQNCLESIKNT